MSKTLKTFLSEAGTKKLSAAQRKKVKAATFDNNWAAGGLVLAGILKDSSLRKGYNEYIDDLRARGGYPTPDLARALKGYHNVLLSKIRKAYDSESAAWVEKEILWSLKLK